MLKFTLNPLETNLFTNSKFAHNLGTWRTSLILILLAWPFISIFTRMEPLPTIYSMPSFLMNVFSNIDRFIGVKGLLVWSHVLSCFGINDPFAHVDCIKSIIHCKCIYSCSFHFQLLHCLHYIFFIVYFFGTKNAMWPNLSQF